MNTPFLDLSNQEHWEGVLRQTFSIAPTPKKKAIRPFYRTVTGNNLLVGCLSTKAQEHWRFGLNLTVSVTASPNAYAGFSNQMVVFEKAVMLNQPTLIRFPRYQPEPYRVAFTIPYWHKMMYVEVWQYVGPQSSSVEQMLGQILSQVQQQ